MTFFHLDWQKSTYVQNVEKYEKKNINKTYS